jgi:hypothetical protein
MKELDYDQLMCFFANEKVSKIVELAQDRLRLAEALRNYDQPNWGSLEPDTIEAQEAATSDGEMYDRAEERIYRLLDTNPETFTTIVSVLSWEWPESGLARHLDDYRAQRGLFSGWSPGDTERDDADEASS